MVELGTKNKALPGDSLDYHFHFKKKQDHVFRINSPSGFFFADHFRWRLKRMTDM
jgi:hypothetical protein